jgi:hypothetical protein
MTGWGRPMLYAMIAGLILIAFAWVVADGLRGLAHDHVVPVPVRVEP